MRPGTVVLYYLYTTQVDVPRFQCPKATQSVFARNLRSSVSRVPHTMSSALTRVMLRAGSRGVSLLFSSGDAGVGDGNPDPKTQQCFTNNGQNQTKFLPHFPASCPLCVYILPFFPLLTNRVHTLG